MLTLPNIFLAAAFTLACVGLLLRDGLWMRVLLLASSAAGIAFFYVSPDQMPVAGLCLWLLIAANGFRIALMLRERQSLHWTAEEYELQSSLFKTMPSRSFRKLMKAGRWRTLKPESLIVVEGREVKHVALVYSGMAAVQVGGATVAYVKMGSFVGEMALLTGAPASATVKAVQPVRCLMWEISALRDLMSRDRDISAALQHVFSTDLMGKLSKSSSKRGTKRVVNDEEEDEQE